MNINIRRVILENFREYQKRTEINLNENFLTFIGPNSSGKSTVFNALLKVFSKNPIERVILKQDFSNFHYGSTKEEKEQILIINILLEFKNLQPSTLDNYGWKRIHGDAFYFEGNDGYIELQLEASLLYYQTRYYDVVSSINFRKNGKNIIREDNAGLDIRRIVEIFYVPASRNPNIEMTFDSETILFRILELIKKKSDPVKITKIESKAKDLNTELHNVEVIDNVSTVINKKWRNLSQNLEPSVIKFEFSGGKYQEILDNLKINFVNSNGTIFNINNLSDGLKSLFYITLVRTLIEMELEIEATIQTPINQKKFFLVVIEEPENHIAPNLIGRVIEDVKEILTKNRTQVLLSSHSPAIIKRIEPDKLILFTNPKKNEIGPFNNKEDIKEIKFVRTLQAYPELYFSRFIILVEGQSEEIVIPEIFNLKKNPLDLLGIAVVPLGGAHVNHYWNLLNKLEIPYVTLLDLDRERNKGGWSKIKNVVIQLIDKKIVDKQEIEKKIQETGFHVNSSSTLDNMNSWDIGNENVLRNWIDFLQVSYNVYFSYPLDLDFMMLQHFEDEYINGRVPKVKLANAINNTLKGENTSAISYKPDERELMKSYSMLFLSSKGKPTQHQDALIRIGDNLVGMSLPKVLNDLYNKVIKVIK